MLASRDDRATKGIEGIAVGGDGYRTGPGLNDHHVVAGRRVRRRKVDCDGRRGCRVDDRARIHRSQREASGLVHHRRLLRLNGSGNMQLRARSRRADA